MLDLINALPDDRVVNQLTAALRMLRPPEANSVLEGMLAHESRHVRLAGLKISRRIVRTTNTFTHFLDIGLSRKDETEIRLWISSVGSAIGYKKLLKHFEVIANTRPELLVFAWYQLAPLVKNNASELSSALNNLSQAIDFNLDKENMVLLEFWGRVKQAVS
ncbi:hypothetical protein QWZ03_14445 [Chitinimonas viridis]|uniref:HEAT repeat domain-containing protein n=1 Tax=Chitinimonas viridis TaxID=664880 RepID=A0ABT8B8L5_9NEIS|nr:hypothetical protein [Chitinimonas viridis]MDN3577966.1 hypothetical protein [Chitinimonas viridis]